MRAQSPWLKARSPWLFGALMACSGGKADPDGAETDGGGQVTAGDGGDAACGDTAPTIVGGPYCTYLGLKAAEPGLDEVPTLRISASVHDDDGDLHIRSTRIWFDGEPLGKIDVKTAELKTRGPAVGGEKECEAFDLADVGDKIYLQPAAWPPETEMDWGIAVADAEGNWTEMAQVICKTPAADGSAP